jgi:hypothetical protein
MADWILPTIAAAALLATWIKFWMDRGEDRQRITNAEAMVTAVSVKAELLSSHLNEFKLQAARDFASTADLVDAERRFTAAVDNLGSRFDRMAERLDRVLETLSQRVGRE